MSWKALKEKKWFKIMTNTYILVLTIFVIWMAFFDTNSLLIHNELQQEIDKLEQQREFLKREIDHDKKLLEQLEDPKELEKYAREKYYMKKEDEEIFLIEYEDSVKQKN
ncbi:MAG: septum formation initiator family protein [Bacteroidota bacterium]